MTMKCRLRTKSSCRYERCKPVVFTASRAITLCCCTGFGGEKNRRGTGTSHSLPLASRFTNSLYCSKELTPPSSQLQPLLDPTLRRPLPNFLVMFASPTACYRKLLQQHQHWNSLLRVVVNRFLMQCCHLQSRFSMTSCV